MKMRKITQSGKVRGALGLTAIAVVGLSMAACGGKHTSPSSGSVSSAAGKAKVVATAADMQLRHDGYSPVKAPGFGKVDLGYKTGSPHYEVVYTYAGKNQTLLRDAVASAQKKVATQKGVNVKEVGNEVVLQANTLGTLKTALKAVLSSVK
jgi:hypothetical protein